MKNLSIVFLFIVFVSACGKNGTDWTPFSLGEPYLHMSDNENGSGSLDASLKTLTPSNSSMPTIKLMGMVHIGERSFYEKVQEEINTTQKILYEGIGGDDYSAMAAFIPSCHVLAALLEHSQSATMLGLADQTLSYPKYVSTKADVGIEFILDAILSSSFARKYQNEIPNSWNDSKCYQVLWLFSKDTNQDGIDWLNSNTSLPISQIREKKRVQLTGLNRRGHAERLTRPSSGPKEELESTLNQIILEKRNQIVIDQIQNLINASYQGEILVVYGAAHMPGIETELATKFGYQAGLEKRLTVYNY